MDHLLKDILDSPKLPDYVEELKQYVLQEEAKRNAFYENIRDDEKGEFINGEIVYHSPAKEKHLAAIEHLGNIFSRFVQKNKAGIIRREKALVKLRRNDFEPDICYFRKEISNAFNPDTMFFPVPDFVVEVLNSSTEKIDRGVKFIDYALNGVKEYWIVDADKKFVEQYFLEGEVFVLNEKRLYGSIYCKVLTGLEIPLETIFDEEANEDFLNEM